MAERIIPVRTYVFVCIALLALTVLTYAVAQINLGPWNTVVALAIALVKASLVILFFMHVRYSNHLTVVFLLAGVLWLGILLAGTLNDFVTRSWLNIPGK